MKDTRVHERLIRARVKLLMSQPFWGVLATRLVLKDCTDEEWCTTAATDGKHLYYNIDFVDKLDDEEIVFLVAHEISHCIYRHTERIGGRSKPHWNVAADYVINSDLVDHNIGKLPRDKDIAPCYDSKYKGMSAEEVYELIKDKDVGETHFDIHIVPATSSPSDPSTNVYDSPGIELSQEEWNQIGDDFTAALIDAAKSNSGNLPGNIKRIVGNITEPQMDWREILNKTLMSYNKEDYTWQRCSRKTQAMGIYLPSLKDSEKINIVIGIDSSGSITEQMIRDFLGEVKGIMEQFNDFIVRVWCSDTKVYNDQIFTPDNMNEIDDFEIMGRGGNDFNCNWDYMKKHDIVPDTFLHFTDSFDCGLGFGDPNYCDTIYVIHSDPKRERTAPAPFVTIWYEN